MYKLFVVKYVTYIILKKCVDSVYNKIYVGYFYYCHDR